MSPQTPKEKKSKRGFGPVVIYTILPIVLYAFTSLPAINKLTPIIALVALAALIVVRFVPSKTASASVTLWVILVLSLVGATGWFYSPFFFALYLMAIGLGFLYTPGVAIGFTLALIVMFATSVGEVNPLNDFLTLASLLSVIPITIFLRKSFLLVQQEKKGILILENTSNKSGITSLEAILENKVNLIGVTLRQPITYLKQGLAMLAENNLSEKEFTETLTRMRKASEELATLVKEFERGTTNNKFLSGGTK